MTQDLSQFTDDELRAELRQRRIQRLRKEERSYSGWIAPLIPRIRELSSQGMTVRDIARLIQIDKTINEIRKSRNLHSITEGALCCSIRNVMKILDIPINTHVPDIKNQIKQRWKYAYYLRKDGKTFREIGEILGVNTKRASQLVKKGETLVYTLD